VNNVPTAGARLDNMNMEACSHDDSTMNLYSALTGSGTLALPSQAEEVEHIRRADIEFIESIFGRKDQPWSGSSYRAIGFVVCSDTTPLTSIDKGRSNYSPSTCRDV
jgi:hypothetical protein